MSFKKGLEAENIAVQYLENIGFKILDRNYHSKYGEIDIISKKDNILHFIEVKSGNSFNPAYNLTQRKIDRILQTVDIYLSKAYLNIDISIDLMTISEENIELLENITIE